MTRTDSSWTRFWNSGPWWKALLMIAAYWVVYQLITFAFTSVFAGSIDETDPLSTPLSVVLGMALPILLAGVLLLLFARSVGWVGELFAPQRPRGGAWMWVAVVLVLIPIVMHLIATDWSFWSITLVLSILFLGLAVGLTEEVATRGLVVVMLRRGGYDERIVFLVSSVIFALLHVGNLISGQAVTTVAVTVIYTFGFGAMMYLSLRITGSLVWPILLHAATDPTTILATGGIDAHSPAMGAADPLVVLAGFFAPLYVLVALIAIFFVKGRMSAKEPVA